MSRILSKVTTPGHASRLRRGSLPSTEKSQKSRSCVVPWKRRVVDSLLSYLLRPKRGRKKCRAHRWWCETWNGWRDAQRKGAFYGRDFDVWQFIIFGLFHFDCCCGMFLKFKWQHGSESESIHSRLMAVCKACPPKPKGVLTSSGTSSISPEGVSRFLRRRERQKWKIGSSMRTSICGLVGNENKRNLKTYWHTRPRCLERSDQYFGRNMFSFFGRMVLCMYYVDYV